MNLKRLLLEKNEAGWDRAVRVLAGFLLVVVFAQWWLTWWLNFLLLFAAVIAVFTGLSGHCTLYPLLGIRTAK